jgi:hypothetical protein
MRWVSAEFFAMPRHPRHPFNPPSATFAQYSKHFPAANLFHNSKNYPFSPNFWDFPNKRVIQSTK